MMKMGIQGTRRWVIPIKMEGLHLMRLPMDIERNTITGIIPNVQSIMTVDGKYTFI
jgi:hypothetical protein